ncbi:hypothetical protein A2U01_0060312, partial [Trifolium medium]|nr:hypothetical protein [Trifolium medium]
MLEFAFKLKQETCFETDPCARRRGCCARRNVEAVWVVFVLCAAPGVAWPALGAAC